MAEQKETGARVPGAPVVDANGDAPGQEGSLGGDPIALAGTRRETAQREPGGSEQVPPADRVILVSEPHLEEAFRSLVAEWRRSVRPSSQLDEMLNHPAYQRIIGMGLAVGEPVVRLMLLQLRDHDHHWFTALESVAGEDPAAGETTFSGMKTAWLRWGQSQGLIE
jgi:hypothetical protein